MTMGTTVQLNLELQRSAVADEVSAITAIVRPILRGILTSLKGEVVLEAGGLDNLKLFMLARLRRPGDGDVGICFEYAVHDALTRREPVVTDRIADALRRCNVPGTSVASLLFGAEKSGTKALIATARSALTDESVLLYGQRGRPAKLKNYMGTLATAFRSEQVRASLPQRISALWKADLFAGCTDSDKWVGTTLKVNKSQLQAGNGLRVGIVPASQGGRDALYRDDRLNLVVCPLPYDESFMQMFYEAWEVVVHFLAADAKLPKEVALPRPAARQVARYLEDRRDFPVLDVIDALEALAQPELLETTTTEAGVITTSRGTEVTTASLLAPIPFGS